MTVHAAVPAGTLPDRFSTAMARLGPFPPRPRLAVGVSGGADSLALALLADGWARARGGAVLGLVVDHGLRAESAPEAAVTAAWLAARTIPAHILTLRGLRRGPAVAERARNARLEALAQACAGQGIADLLLGHHAADQAETVLIRAMAASGPAGLAGIASLREVAGLRLLRPLLGISPGLLRFWLREAGQGWVEDPSNADPAALRARLRALRADRAGTGAATRALVRAAHVAGLARARAEEACADWLAAHVTLRPEGFALLPPGPWPPDVLSALIATIAGAAYPPAAAVTALAAAPTAVTLHGARLLPAGRLGSGWLLAREVAAMAPPVAAVAGAVWDNRFRLAAGADDPTGLTLGALGDAAASLRRRSDLPAAVLRTLPALRRDGELFAVPHLRYPGDPRCAAVKLCPAMPRPAAAPPFVTAEYL